MNKNHALHFCESTQRNVYSVMAFQCANRLSQTCLL